MILSESQQTLHERALGLSREFRKLESELILVLQEIDQLKLHKRLGYSSLFTYTVGALGLSESTAYSFISVARKAQEVPELKEAILTQQLSVAKASRLVSAISPENATNLVTFAQSHSTRETDFEVARIKPQEAQKERTKIVTEDQIRLERNISKETLKKLNRVESLMASQGNPSFDQVLSEVLREYLKRHDPLEKAKRALAKPKSIKKLCANRVSIKKSLKRTPLKAYEKHIVAAKDGGQCTHIDSSGKRCTNDRWLHIHHLKPISQGGTNDPENLTTLCSFHHDLVHQLSLPIDGQISWIRERSVAYCQTLTVP